MYRLVITLMAATLAFGVTPGANAGDITYTYNVDITGFNASPFLSVQGTITYDTTLQSITTSSLSLYDPTPVAITFPSIPINPGPQAGNSVFTATSTDLHFASVIVGIGAATTVWTPAQGTNIALEAGSNGLSEVDVDVGGQVLGVAETTTGLPGLLVGTASATPEPSTCVLAITAIVLGGGFTAVRKRFKKCSV